MIKPTTAKGTRDFGPETMVKRNLIFNTLKDIFHNHGFVEIQTPSFENLETLTGKYGEEGDQLIFKILNSGDYLRKANESHLAEKNSKALTSSISEKALRYDLTIPFARYVSQHRNDTPLPFKRYQIQPVWRADRPQKGRYREFYQCDVDIIGSTSLFSELELLQIAHESYSALQIKEIEIKVNNRKVLKGIAECVNADDQFDELVVALDKLDKVGKAGVIKELEKRAFSSETIALLNPFFELETATDVISDLKSLLNDSEIGLIGVEELSFIAENTDFAISISPLLARGLNYYTGCIFEVIAHNSGIGSISGGGRYDNLAGMFGYKDVSGVGISFGADRIYDVMEHQGLFTPEIQESSKVLFINFGKEEALKSWSILKELWKNNIPSELYVDNAKLKKQFSYANKKNIPFVAMIGEEELKNNTIQLKEMKSGEQRSLSVSELIEELK